MGFKAIIFFFSTKVKNEIDLFCKKDQLIDFSLSQFKKAYFKIVLKHYPVQYYTQSFTFFENIFVIKKGTFIPRQETEFLLSWCYQNNLIDKAIEIVELCSGSGAIINSIALKSNQDNQKRLIGIEKFQKPYKIGLLNQKKFNTNVIFYKKDIFKIKKNFFQNTDLIICNPPYVNVKSKDWDKTILFEPKKALFAKKNGLVFYYRFFNEYYPYLKVNAKIVFEIGYLQKKHLSFFLKQKNILHFSFHKDLDTNFRILYVTKR